MIFAANFFESVVKFFYCIWLGISTIVEYLKTVILNLVMGVTYVFTAQETILVVIGFVPYAIGGACTAFIAIAILRFFCMK